MYVSRGATLLWLLTGVGEVCEKQMKSWFDVPESYANEWHSRWLCDYPSSVCEYPGTGPTWIHPYNRDIFLLLTLGQNSTLFRKLYECVLFSYWQFYSVCLTFFGLKCRFQWHKTYSAEYLQLPWEYILFIDLTSGKAYPSSVMCKSSWEQGT